MATVRYSGGRDVEGTLTRTGCRVIGTCFPSGTFRIVRCSLTKLFITSKFTNKLKKKQWICVSCYSTVKSKRLYMIINTVLPVGGTVSQCILVLYPRATIIF